MTDIRYRGDKINAKARQRIAEAPTAPADDDFRMLGSKEAAAFLGVTVRTFERWRKEKIGPPPIRTGTRFYYTKDRIKFWQRNGGG